MGENESFIQKLKRNNNIIALTYIFIAVFIFSISNLISKILIENNKAMGFDSINFIMGITMLLINLIMRERDLLNLYRMNGKKEKEKFLEENESLQNNYFFNSFNKNFNNNENYNKIISNEANDREVNCYTKDSKLIETTEKDNYYLHVFSNLKKELNNDFSDTCMFMIRCLLGTFAEIFLFFSFKDLRINTAVTLYAVYPIISSFLSYLYINNNSNKSGKSNLRDFLFLLLCLFFVSFITKPEFIFGTTDDIRKQDHIIGFINITMSILCNAFAIFFHKKVAEKFNNYTFNIFFGINFIWFSFFLMIFDKFSLFFIDFYTIFLLFLMSVLFNINQTLFNLSIKLGDIVVVLPMTYLSIVFGFINNILFFKGIWDIYDLLGSFGIIIINILRIIMTSREGTN